MNHRQALPMIGLRSDKHQFTIRDGGYLQEVAPRYKLLTLLTLLTWFTLLTLFILFKVLYHA